MKKTRYTIMAGCTIFAYWIVFYIFVFGDVYLFWPMAGLLIKVLLPFAFAANIAGMILAVVRIPTEQNVEKAMALALHGIPLVSGVGFIWWLFFGVRI
jgi:hypothetical protein